VHGCFEQYILEENGIKKHKKVGGKNKIKNFSEEKNLSQFPAIVQFCW
jgi:hypothetical protein